MPSERHVHPDDGSDPNGVMYVPPKRERDEAAITIGRRFALGGPVLTIFGVIAGILIVAWVKLESHGSELANLKQAQADASNESARRYEKLDTKLDRLLEIVLEKKKNP